MTAVKKKNLPEKKEIDHWVIYEYYLNKRALGTHAGQNFAHFY